MKSIPYHTFLFAHLLFICIHCKPKEFDFYAYYKEYGNCSGQQFVAQFPFEAYLKKYPITDLASIENHRVFLEERKQTGDIFFCRVFETYISSLADEKVKIQAQRFLETGLYCLTVQVTPNTSYFDIYHVVGYHLLGKAARILESKKSRFTDQEYAEMRRQLEDNHVLLTVEESTWTKIKNRPLGHTFKRAWEKFFSSDEYDNLILRPLVTEAVMSETKLFDMFEGDKYVGAAVWMHRDEVKCRYLAEKNIAKQYDQIKQGNFVLAVTSGGFTNDQRQPEGLTFQNGQIINTILMPDRDGLVIIEATGRIRVCNIKKGIILPQTNKKIKPLQSLIDYIDLVAWCKRNKATVFQTQLLALGDELLIDPEKADKELRERRFVAVSRSHDRPEEVHYIIFNFKESKQLAIAAIEVFRALQKRGKKVEAILNLDVGSFNILEVYNAHSQALPQIQGTKPVVNATNLLVFQKR
jgi:hypothetical protein